MNISLGSFFRPAFASKHDIEIMYFGRPSALLLMTSERMDIPENCTLTQVLDRLRKRDRRWAYELDDSHVICTVNGKTAALSERITAGDEMGIFSRISWDEI